MSDPSTDQRRYAPPAQRNREAIAAVLRDMLPSRGSVLHIAEGSGEHIIHFARAFPHLTFVPSDPDPAAGESIAAWIKTEALQNILPPLALDASSDDWPVERANAIVCINMIHISPWSATEGLMRGAAKLLPVGAPLFLYGPYKRDGRHTAPSNENFEGWLKSQNPEFGVRDLDDVADCAGTQGFSPPQVIEMPANNLSVVFRKQYQAG